MNTARSIMQQPFGDSIMIIHPPASLDNRNAHEMIDTLTSCQASGYKFIILDMGKVEFLSSAGVGSILGTVEMFREEGGDIVICNVAETVLHILEVLDLHEYFTITPNQKEAETLCRQV